MQDFIALISKLALRSTDARHADNRYLAAVNCHY
jgi:hypothetical protein